MSDVAQWQWSCFVFDFLFPGGGVLLDLMLRERPDVSRILPVLAVPGDSHGHGVAQAQHRLPAEFRAGLGAVEAQNGRFHRRVYLRLDDVFRWRVTPLGDD